VYRCAYDMYLFLHSFTPFVLRFEKLNEDLLLLDAKVHEFDKRHDEAGGEPPTATCSAPHAWCRPRTG
jgi:hypothetical protein